MGDSTWVGGFDSHPNIFAAHEERRAHEEEERMSTALQHGRKAESAPPARSNCQGASNGTEPRTNLRIFSFLLAGVGLQHGLLLPHSARGVFMYRYRCVRRRLV